MVSLFFLRRLPLISRKPFRRPSGEPVSTLRSGVFEAGRDHAIEEPLIDRNLRIEESLRKRLVVEGRRHFVAGGIPRVSAEPCLRILVVPPREEADPQRRIGHPDGGSWIHRIAGVADLDTGVHIGRRRAHHHELRAAGVDEVMERNHRHARRIQAHFHVLCDRGGRLPHAEEHGAVRGDDYTRRPICERRVRRFADGAADGDAPGAGPVDLFRRDRHRLAALLDRHFRSGHRRIRLDRNTQRRRAADIFLW